jgi:hypothetical protein
MSRHLKVYDKLRQAHAIIKTIPPCEDEWQQNAIDAVHSVLYLAESAFTAEPMLACYSRAAGAAEKVKMMDRATFWMMEQRLKRAMP